MKQRVTGLDLTILTRELQQEIQNFRLSNIYNVASNPNRQFLLRFSIPDSKKAVMLECGHRVHLTSFDQQTTATPSNFVAKLRKHLKTRRLTGISQINEDRVLVMSFSDGLYYLVLEFFSAGNIVLLDQNQKILMLNRVVREHENNERYAVNETYSMFDRHELFGDAAPKEDDSQEVESKQHQVKKYTQTIPTADDIQGWIDKHKENIVAGGSGKKQKVYSVHKLLFVYNSHLPADLILRELAAEGIDKSTSCLTLDGDKAKLTAAVDAVTRANNVYTQLITVAKVTGYLVSKKNPSYNAEDKLSLEYILDEFHPFKPIKNPEDLYQITPVDGYNHTVDQFFSTIESSKNLVKLERQKFSAAKRLESARSERDRQIQSLVEQSEVNKRKGETIIFHADLVTECIEFITKLVNQQMDWTNIESFIKLEQKKANDIAKVIKLPLKLEENKIQLQLTDGNYDPDISSDSPLGSESSESDTSESDSDSDSDSDSNDLKLHRRKPTKPKKTVPPTLNVWIDYKLSPYANAAAYFDTKKSAESKQLKVERNTGFALKNAERKITKDLNRQLKEEEATGGKLRQIRPKYWFEKFFWFVTSDGYLCLAGKDFSQTDMIYFRHVSDNDFLVSADVEGSLKVFIKNPFQGEDLPPSTLMQAAVYALASSTAWSGKVTTSAWVIRTKGISKKDIDDTLLGPGEFKFVAKKEFLPPTQLVMGLGVYMLGDDETADRDTTKRVEKYEEHGLKVVLDNKKEDLASLAKLKFKHEMEAPSNGKEVNGEESDDKNVPMESSESVEPSPEPSEEPSVEPTKKHVRGKKAKLKKIKTKYGDQDDEERQLRMDILGTLKQVQNQQSQEQTTDETQKQQQRQMAAERKRKQDAREYLKYIMAAEDDESSETDYLKSLDRFISKPQRGDKFIGCVPVFAPWMSLTKFKYKIKVQPGTGKKGKAISESVHHWISRKVDQGEEDPEVDWPSEHGHIEAIKSNDAMGLITTSKVRLVMPAGANDKKGSGNTKVSGKKSAPTKKKGKK